MMFFFSYHLLKGLELKWISYCWVEYEVVITPSTITKTYFI
jgi:hypothetical protein